MPKRATLDPLNVNAMLYEEMASLLRELKKNRTKLSFKDRATVLVYIMRMQTGFVGLRRENFDDPTAGSAVRKYATAFKAHAARGGKNPARPGAGSVGGVDNLDAPDLDDDDAAA